MDNDESRSGGKYFSPEARFIDIGLRRVLCTSPGINPYSPGSSSDGPDGNGFDMDVY